MRQPNAVSAVLPSMVEYNQFLFDHLDEVFMLAFSHDGSSETFSARGVLISLAKICPIPTVQNIYFFEALNRILEIENGVTDDDLITISKIFSELIEITDTNQLFYAFSSDKCFMKNFIRHIDRSPVYQALYSLTELSNFDLMNFFEDTGIVDLLYNTISDTKETNDNIFKILSRILKNVEVNGSIFIQATLFPRIERFIKIALNGNVNAMHLLVTICSKSYEEAGDEEIDDSLPQSRTFAIVREYLKELCDLILEGTNMNQIHVLALTLLDLYLKTTHVSINDFIINMASVLFTRLTELKNHSIFHCVFMTFFETILNSSSGPEIIEKGRIKEKILDALDFEDKNDNLCFLYEFSYWINQIIEPIESNEDWDNFSRGPLEEYLRVSQSEYGGKLPNVEDFKVVNITGPNQDRLPESPPYWVSPNRLDPRRLPESPNLWISPNNIKFKRPSESPPPYWIDSMILNDKMPSEDSEDNSEEDIKEALLIIQDTLNSIKK